MLETKILEGLIASGGAIIGIGRVTEEGDTRVDEDGNPIIIDE
jgi:hypothetical protein